MRALVDSAREPRHHDIAGPAEAAREAVGEGESRRRGVARSDDRRRGLLQRLDAAAACQKRRSGVDLAEERRVVRLADRDEAHAEPERERELPLDLLGRRQPRTGRGAPPRRASSGSASSAARAPPYLSISARKVRGPTFSDRTRRSQSNR